MGALSCPHCGLPAMSAWRKAALGPAGRVPCRQCGLAVGVAPGPALLAMLPCGLVVLLALGGAVRRPLPLIAAAVLAIVATAVLHQRAVPLVRRQLTDAQAVRAAHGRNGPAPE